MTQIVLWEIIPIFIITILLAMVKSNQSLVNNIMGSSIIAFLAYMILKIPIIGLNGITNPIHNLAASIISSLICCSFAIFAILRSCDGKIPILYKFFNKNN